MAAEPLLRLRGFSLARREGGGERPLLSDLDLDVVPGRWVALLGANGAGKSSLLRYLAADEAPCGRDAALVFQDPDDQLVAASVDAELALGRPGADPAALRADYGLGDRGGVPPRLLSAGEKQRLALAVALGQAPRLLLCDEPTALQDAAQAAWVLERLDRWRRASGGALVTATCDRAEAARADELLVLADGRVAARGAPDTLLDAPAVRALLDAPAPRPVPDPGPGAPAVLELAGVVCRFGAHGVGPLDLTVRAGERVGLTGPNGCGKSTLLAACAGLRRPDAGTVRVGGRRFYARPGRDLDLDHGLALLAPQFPEYLFTAGSVAQEIALDPRLARRAGDLAGELGLPPGVLARDPHTLSTGQRRRLALGLVLAAGRPLVLLDEPAAALDRQGRERVLALLERTAGDAAVVVASHDTGFLAAAGCRRVEISART